MVTNITTKINLLAANYKLLVVGTLPTSINTLLTNTFIHIEQFDITEESSEILNQSLFEQFEAVIVSLDSKDFEMFSKYCSKGIQNVIYIVDDELYDDFKPFINESFALLINPISEELLLSKLFGILSTYETINLLKSKEKVINKYKNDIVNDDIDEFLDQYIGNIMFINDDLNENLERLKDLELSKEIFKGMGQSLIQLGNIFKQNGHLAHLSNMLFDFGVFLEELELESIDPSRYSAFDYLTTIIEDLTIYIEELVVYRLFKNVHIFEDSVENNINYFKAQITGEQEGEEDDDNLEFF